MKELEDLQEKIFFECKNIIETLSSINNVEDLLAKKGLADQLIERISFLRVLEKNNDYFKNFSKQELVLDELESKSPTSVKDQDVDMEEEVLFTNELNDFNNEDVEDENKDFISLNVEENLDHHVEPDETFNQIVEHQVVEALEIETTEIENGLSTAEFFVPDTSKEEVENRVIEKLSSIEEADEEVTSTDVMVLNEEEHDAFLLDELLDDEATPFLAEDVVFSNDENIESTSIIVNRAEDQANFGVEQTKNENESQSEVLEGSQVLLAEDLPKEMFVRELESEEINISNDNAEYPEVQNQEQNHSEQGLRKSDEDFEKSIHQEENAKKFKLSHIKSLKSIESLFDADILEELEQNAVAQQVVIDIEEKGSLAKANMPTDFMQAEKPRPEFRLDLNDKIAFSKYLFNGSQSDLNDAIRILNSFKNLDDAKEYLSDIYYERKWDKVDDYAQRLWILVENKFR